MNSNELRQRKVRLGDLLVQAGLISDGQLQLALQEQKRSGAKLGRAVVDLGFVSEVKLLEALSRQLNIPYVDLRQFKLDATLIQRLPEALARRFRAILLVEESDGLLVGMADPLDLYALDEMTRLLRQPLKPAVVREGDLLDSLDRFYRRTGEIAELAGQLDERIEESNFDFSGLSLDNSDAPVVRLLQMLFEDAVQMKASDIHIEPDEQVLRIRQRIDGALNEQLIKETRIASALVLRLKIMAGLDISEKRLPQDGRFNIRVKNRNLDVRVSTMPVQFGESVVMRLLDQSAGVFSLERTGMPTDMLARLRILLQRPHGIVLVTGPTGSGKTTTLYAGLSELNSPEKKIITVE
ncbi:MAG TPA: ATPase, T2SS/T4P/T4SS family, partial [Pseudomonas sp.]|nr:ATPase, T2SS/T4P/T4SS family [Pseudomonas sp.]